MIAEIGHYALVLALGLALVQAMRADVGARTRRSGLMASAGRRRSRSSCSWRSRSRR